MSPIATAPDPTSADSEAIRPFRVDMPQAEIDELRRRLVATPWPEKETVADQSQGVQLATIQALARYWAGDYDFGRLEARLNAVPQFMTEIDGLDIHFIHVRSPHANAPPMIKLIRQQGPIEDRRFEIEFLSAGAEAYCFTFG